MSETIKITTIKDGKETIVKANCSFNIPLNIARISFEANDRHPSPPDLIIGIDDLLSGRKKISDGSTDFFEFIR